MPRQLYREELIALHLELDYRTTYSSQRRKKGGILHEQLPRYLSQKLDDHGNLSEIRYEEKSAEVKSQVSVHLDIPLQSWLQAPQCHIRVDAWAHCRLL